MKNPAFYDILKSKLKRLKKLIFSHELFQWRFGGKKVSHIFLQTSRGTRKTFHDSQQDFNTVGV